MAEMRTSLQPPPDATPVSGCATCSSKKEKKKDDEEAKVLVDGKVVHNSLSDLPPEKVDQISDAATNHAYVHGEFSADAAARGNTALAYNEAADSQFGASTARDAADALRIQSDNAPGNTGLADIASRAELRAVEAQSYATNALQGAEALGPNPGIPGTPRLPSWEGYPGGPLRPFLNPNPTSNG